MTRSAWILTLCVPLLAPALAAAQPETFTSVGDLLDKAESDPAFAHLKQSPRWVQIQRAVVVTGDVQTGGTLPTQGQLSLHDDEEIEDGYERPWDLDPSDLENPYRAFDVGDAVGGPARIRVHQVTRFWRWDWDEWSLERAEAPEARRGYVFRLDGTLVWDAQAQRFTLYPHLDPVDQDAGVFWGYMARIEVTGTEGEPLRPLLVDRSYADELIVAGDELLLRGLQLTPDVQVRAAGQPLTVVDVQGKLLRVRADGALPHGVLTITVERPGVGGAGQVRVGFNGEPRVDRVSPSVLRPGGLAVLSGQHLTRVSSVAPLGGSVFGLGTTQPTVRVGGLVARVLRATDSVLVCRLDAQTASGTQTVVVEQPGGPSAPVLVQVGHSAGAPVLSAATVEAGGLLVLSGRDLAMNAGEEGALRVLLADGTALTVIAASPDGVVAELPAGLTQGLVRVSVPQRGESGPLAFGAVAGLVGGLGQ